MMSSRGSRPDPGDSTTDGTAIIEMMQEQLAGAPDDLDPKALFVL